MNMINMKRYHLNLVKYASFAIDINSVMKFVINCFLKQAITLRPPLIHIVDKLCPLGVTLFSCK